MRSFPFFRHKQTHRISKPSPRRSYSSILATGIWHVGKRSYLRDVAYGLPKDGSETLRLNFQHHLMHRGFGTDIHAPIFGTRRHPETPTMILDVGTGTGIWANEVAIHLPDTQVIAIDLQTPPNDLPNSSAIRPPNYRYLPANLLETLPFEDETFCYVHMRLMIAAIPREAWGMVIAELKRVTKKGGWIELVEVTMPDTQSPAMLRLSGWMDQTMQRKGDVDVYLAQHIKTFLIDAELKWVEQRSFTMQLLPGNGPNNMRTLEGLGSMMTMNYFNVLTAFQPIMRAFDVVDEHTFHQTLEQARAELTRYRTRMSYIAAFGQKG